MFSIEISVMYSTTNNLSKTLFCMYQKMAEIIKTRLEIFTAVVAEKARGGNFLHFLRHSGNKFYFPPPQRK
jgi:hypothetical protein